MKVADEPQSSNSVDPLHDFSVPSLFPRTFRVSSTNAPKPNHPDDLESIHGFMKSMVLRSPKKHVDQAKAIVNGSLVLLNSDFASFLASENKNESVAAKGKENVRERRPGLGNRRARFSMKPISSQPYVNVEPSGDIEQLEDPEEYFLAHVRNENAKKELQRQMGGSMSDMNVYNNNLSKTERRRRPGLPGRKASYKPPGNDNTFTCQETLGQDILSPPNNISQPETANPNAELEKDLTGSISKTENEVNELLDMLSDKCENLDEDGVVSLLQDHLQIKPLNLDKLCLPEFHVGKNDLIDFGANLPKPRNTLSDINTFVTGRSGKTPIKCKQVVESPAYSIDSPTPPKSPFASISLLKKHILKFNLPSDPFSALVLSPARNSSSEHVDEQSDQYSKKKKGVSVGLDSLITEIGDIRADDVGSQETITEDPILPFEKSVNDNSTGFGIGINVMSSASHGNLKEPNGSRSMDDSRLNTDTGFEANRTNEIEENDSRLNTDSDVQTNGPCEMADNAGDMLQDAVLLGDVSIGDSSTPFTVVQTDEPNEMEKHVEDMTDIAEAVINDKLQIEDMPQNAEPDINIENTTTGKLDGNQSKQDQSSSTAVRSHAMDVPSETVHAIPEQHIKEPSRVSLNDQGMARRPSRGGNKRKTLSHRQSLAGSGTYWESGVRRSKRIKMRPLEYWKGERFLYGRVHESLTTIIGVKYISPAKGGDGMPSIKVKSYVSDEYKELVELAALH